MQYCVKCGGSVLEEGDIVALIEPLCECNKPAITFPKPPKL